MRKKYEDFVYLYRFCDWLSLIVYWVLKSMVSIYWRGESIDNDFYFFEIFAISRIFDKDCLVSALLCGIDLNKEFNRHL